MFMVKRIFIILLAVVLGLAVTGCSLAGIKNPLQRYQDRKFVNDYDKKVVQVAVQAKADFHKEFNAFCKTNKDGNKRNTKRTELAKKYFEQVKELKVQNVTIQEVGKLKVEQRECANRYVKAIEEYFANTMLITDDNPEIRKKAWQQIGVNDRIAFDTGFEYRHLNSKAVGKKGTYTVGHVSWLRNGHNYYHFTSAYKMPGKPLSSESIVINGKTVTQDIYLWSYKDAAVLVVFHNGKAVSISDNGL